MIIFGGFFTYTKLQIEKKSVRSKKITIMRLILFFVSFFASLHLIAQSDSNSVLAPQNAVYEVKTVCATQSPKVFEMDNSINYIQIENGEIVINFRSRGEVTYYQGTIKNYTDNSDKPGETASFYIAPNGRGSKTISIEMRTDESGKTEFHLFDKMNSRIDKKVVAVLSDKTYLNQ
jgi:hypothetical protein